MLYEDADTSWQQAYTFDDEAIIALSAQYAITASPMASGVWQLALRESKSGTIVAFHTAQQPTAILHAVADSDLLFCALGSRIMCVKQGAIIAQSDMMDDSPVSCLAVNDGKVFAGTRTALAVSNDNAQSWEYTASVEPIVALHADTSGKVNAVALGGRLLEVTN